MREATISAVAVTDYEAVPSVAGPERLKNVALRLVAAREAGNRVVGVLSAMGDSTDDLIALAHQVSHAASFTPSATRRCSTSSPRGGGYRALTGRREM
jgi:hypothetical protein